MAVVIAVDAGTTGVRAMAVGENGQITGSRYREFPQHFPRPGWVEHDPEQIWHAVAGTLADLLDQLDEPSSPSASPTSVRPRWPGTAVTGRAASSGHRVAGPPDGAAYARPSRPAGHLDLVRARTGLVLDPYFSATKMSWLMNEGGLAASPHLAFGTVDSWLLWRLTDGAVHLTDTTNASRTLLFDINQLKWDSELADLFGVPMPALPEVGPSSGRIAVTATGVVPGLPAGIPISGVAGDQQAALFGQGCFVPGMTKNTYGTGSFVLMNVGGSFPDPGRGSAHDGGLVARGTPTRRLRPGRGHLHHRSGSAVAARRLGTDSGIGCGGAAGRIGQSTAVGPTWCPP